MRGMIVKYKSLYFTLAAISKIRSLVFYLGADDGFQGRFLLKKLLVETTGYQRNRVFVFDEYMRMF